MIIGDKRMPYEAQKKLQSIGNFIPFFTEGITYDAIAGHPDIFICPMDNRLVVAPNLPLKYKLALQKEGVLYVEGNESVGNKYPETARFNAVVTKNYFIHNLKITDKVLLQQGDNKIHIDVHQGYTRCNLFPLPDESFITSDKGIFNTMTENGLTVLYVKPQEILLSGFPHGFIGGCLGGNQNSIFVIGRLSSHPEGKKILQFIKRKNLHLILLYDGPLFDGGSLLFL